jgi:adenine-specific DNA-methyltransferase
MRQLKLHTPDIRAMNIEKLAALFPNCATEIEDAKGNLKRGIDFDQLRQELADHVVEGPRERYHLDWAGKREALLVANTSIAKTLRPHPEESVDFDTTKNLFIEGDNLDALKLLQETYLGKVKLIYIDPPYNTGNEFIYDDDFRENSQEYFKRSNQTSDGGERMVVNLDSNGRFHSDWLSMMFSRLKLARNLLRDDGLLFASIDHNEGANLKRVCDEIFGESNFRGQVSRATGTPSGQGNDILVNEIDYILVYSKTSEAALRGLPFSEEDGDIYDQVDSKGRYLTRSLRKTGGEDRREDRPTMYYKLTDPDGGEVWPIGPGGYQSRWRCSGDTYIELNAANRIEWKRITEDGVTNWKPYQKFYLEGRLKQPSNLWQGIEGNKKASIDVRNLFGAKVFDFPKPVELIRRCLEIGTDKDSVVLDFFAGSATTAHATMALNAMDGGMRRSILVQIPEICAETTEAFKAGYKTIAEVSKERIRRAGAKIKGENATTAPNLDVGFRVLKIDTSNMEDVYYAPDVVKQTDLVAHTDNIKPDRTPEDLLFQVLVDWGVDLSLPIKCETVASKKVFFVDGNALAACFDPKVSEELVKQLAKRKPLRAVFRDSSYDSDSVKINVEQIFKLLSPETEVKSL